MADYESGQPADKDAYVLVGHPKAPVHFGQESLLELLHDTPQLRDYSAISHDHVQVNTFMIEDLINVLHTFPWMWENARFALENDADLMKWSATNNQDGSVEYIQLSDTGLGDNLQDGMYKEYACEVDQVTDCGALPPVPP